MTSFAVGTIVVAITAPTATVSSFAALVMAMVLAELFRRIWDIDVVSSGVLGTMSEHQRCEGDVAFGLFAL